MQIGRCNFRQLSIVNCQTKRKSISTKQFAKINAIRCFLWNTTITNNTGAVPQTAAITVIKVLSMLLIQRQTTFPKICRLRMYIDSLWLKNQHKRKCYFNLWQKNFGLWYGSHKYCFQSIVLFLHRKKHYQNNGKQKGATRKLPNKIFIPTRLRKRYPLCKQSAKENVGISTPTNMIIRTVFCLFTFRNSFK